MKKHKPTNGPYIPIGIFLSLLSQITEFRPNTYTPYPIYYLGLILALVAVGIIKTQFKKNPFKPDYDIQDAPPLARRAVLILIAILLVLAGWLIGDLIFIYFQRIR